MESTYAFVNARAIQEQRLKLLSALLDEGTFRVLEQRGVQPGWRCLEIGAGGGSVAAWMCERVGPTGSVLATDLDTTVVGRLRHPNLEVRVHDVLSDELTEDEFDLAHARLVLAWLTDPSAALRRIAAALKPGGSLVIEEMDFLSPVPDPRVDPRDRELFEAAIRAHNAVLGSQHAFDPLSAGGPWER
jgi:ubiquinone/menaquinone biosynthesis C-methylase UbiE